MLSLAFYDSATIRLYACRMLHSIVDGSFRESAPELFFYARFTDRSRGQGTPNPGYADMRGYAMVSGHGRAQPELAVSSHQFGGLISFQLPL